MYWSVHWLDNNSQTRWFAEWPTRSTQREKPLYGHLDTMWKSMADECFVKRTKPKRSLFQNGAIFKLCSFFWHHTTGWCITAMICDLCAVGQWPALNTSFCMHWNRYCMLSANRTGIRPHKVCSVQWTNCFCAHLPSPMWAKQDWI